MSGRRDDPDTQDALQKMQSAFDSGEQRPGKIGRFLTFQVFASTLLLIVVILSGVSLTLALESEQEARERAENRVVLFEDQIEIVLDSIEDAQSEATDDRDEIYRILEHIEQMLSDF